jgi:hypothetical protein
VELCLSGKKISCNATPTGRKESITSPDWSTNFVHLKHVKVKGAKRGEISE